LCYINSTRNALCERSLKNHNMSQVNHYRGKVYKRETNETVMDTEIWKFKDELIRAVNETLAATNFTP
jgi:hypothetical protein